MSLHRAGSDCDPSQTDGSDLRRIVRDLPFALAGRNNHGPNYRTPRARLFCGNWPVVPDLQRDVALGAAHDAAHLGRRRRERAQLPDHAALCDLSIR